MSQEPTEAIEILRLLGEFAVLMWALFIFVLSGLMSVLAWLNSHMPSSLYCKLAVIWFDGVLLAGITALWFGDAFLNGEITIVRYTLYILMSSIGGAPLLRKLIASTRTLMKKE